VPAVEQGLELELFDERFERRDFAGHFGRERRILGGHLDHRGQVVAAFDCFIQRSDNRRERLPLFDGRLGFFLAAPEIGLSHAGVDRRDAGLLGRVVKESLVVGGCLRGSLWPGR